MSLHTDTYQLLGQAGSISKKNSCKHNMSWSRVYYKLCTIGNMMCYVITGQILLNLKGQGKPLFIFGYYIFW